MVSWMEAVAYAAGDPARVAVLIALAQSEWALDDAALTQSSGLLHQQITGQPLETAIFMKHIQDLAAQGLLERDGTGFRWRMTPLGQLVSRQWVSSAFDPPGESALSHDEVRAWRDRIIGQLEDDALLADEAGIPIDELAAGSALRLSELRVLNRVIADDRLPQWLDDLRQS